MRTRVAVVAGALATLAGLAGAGAVAATGRPEPSRVPVIPAPAAVESDMDATGAETTEDSDEMSTDQGGPEAASGTHGDAGDHSGAGSSGSDSDDDPADDHHEDEVDD